jgi:hypothetical protein
MKSRFDQMTEAERKADYKARKDQEAKRIKEQPITRAAAHNALADYLKAILPELVAAFDAGFKINTGGDLSKRDKARIDAILEKHNTPKTRGYLSMRGNNARLEARADYSYPCWRPGDTTHASVQKTAYFYELGIPSFPGATTEPAHSLYKPERDDMKHISAAELVAAATEVRAIEDQLSELRSRQSSLKILLGE